MGKVKLKLVQSDGSIGLSIPVNWTWNNDNKTRQTVNEWLASIKRFIKIN